MMQAPKWGLLRIINLIVRHYAATTKSREIPTGAIANFAIAKFLASMAAIFAMAAATSAMASDAGVQTFQSQDRVQLVDTTSQVSTPNSTPKLNDAFVSICNAELSSTEYGGELINAISSLLRSSILLSVGIFSFSGFSQYISSTEHSSSLRCPISSGGGI